MEGANDRAEILPEPVPAALARFDPVQAARRGTPIPDGNADATGGGVDVACGSGLTAGYCRKAGRRARPGRHHWVRQLSRAELDRIKLAITSRSQTDRSLYDGFNICRFCSLRAFQAFALRVRRDQDRRLGRDRGPAFVPPVVAGDEASDFRAAIVALRDLVGPVCVGAQARPALVARAAGVSVTPVWRLMRSGERVSVRTVVEVLAAFSVQPGDARELICLSLLGDRYLSSRARGYLKRVLYVRDAGDGGSQ